MAKLTKRIYAVSPGDVYPDWIEEGTEVSGRLEEIAKDLGAVSGKKSLKGAPENK